jgi:hypothetical protein
MSDDIDTDAPDEVYELLRDAVVECEPLLQHVWARRTADTDIIVLAHMGWDSSKRYARSWWPEENIRRAAGADGPRAFLPYVQPEALIDLLLASDNEANRETGKELRALARGRPPALVPLLIVMGTGTLTRYWLSPAPGADRGPWPGCSASRDWAAWQGPDCRPARSGVQDLRGVHP